MNWHIAKNVFVIVDKTELIGSNKFFFKKIKAKQKRRLWNPKRMSFSGTYARAQSNQKPPHSNQSYRKVTKGHRRVTKSHRKVTKSHQETT